MGLAFAWSTRGFSAILTLTSTWQGAPMLADAGRNHTDDPSAISTAAGKDIAVPAEDGRRLAASLFVPLGGAAATAPLTIIAGGTGITRRYYARFAAYLADRGRPTLTFDYRDTGGSRSGPLSASK